MWVKATDEEKGVKLEDYRVMLWLRIPNLFVK